MSKNRKIKNRTNGKLGKAAEWRERAKVGVGVYPWHPRGYDSGVVKRGR